MPRQTKLQKKSEDHQQAKKQKTDPAARLAAFDFFDDNDDDETSINEGSVSSPTPQPVQRPAPAPVQEKKVQQNKKPAVHKPQQPAVQQRRKREIIQEVELDDDCDDITPLESGREQQSDMGLGGGDFGVEMKKMLEGFGADYNKTVSNKRKRLDQFIGATVRNSNKKVEDLWRGQQSSRQKLTEEYCKQVNSVFGQWETDLEKVREQDEKLQNLLKQQQKLAQQTRVIQNQRLKTIKQLHEAYVKNLSELDSLHEEQQTTIPSELKKEMALLQKRILMDTQQQEMANVRKSLQNMLY